MTFAAGIGSFQTLVPTDLLRHIVELFFIFFLENLKVFVKFFWKLSTHLEGVITWASTKRRLIRAMEE
jgi:hypothetical protein